jgi:putative membrane protein
VRIVVSASLSFICRYSQKVCIKAYQSQTKSWNPLSTILLNSDLMSVLVLCIDRDDDLGRKAKLESPVIGREENIDAAVKLATADPEDSDTNTIFGGIKVFDELVAGGQKAEIVSMAGDMKVGLTSDAKLASQLEELIARFKPEGVVVVSDGAEDEAILPIIQSRVKVNGVRRVLVKQSPNLESTYYILKQLFTDPKISHTFFIPPGLALLMYSIFSLLGYPNGAVVAITGAIGLYLLFRGGLDEFIDEVKLTLSTSLYAGKMAFITYIMAAMLVVIATIQGAASLWDYYRGDIWYGYLTLIMIYINKSIWWYVAAGFCAVLGKIMDMYLEGTRDARTYSYPFFLIATGLIFWSASAFILASNSSLNFSMATGQSLQYLAVSAVLAVLITLTGVNVSKRIAGPAK